MKIKRIDLLIQVAGAIQEGNYSRANKLLTVIDKSIQSDKSKNIYSSEIELSKDEAKLIKK